MIKFLLMFMVAAGCVDHRSPPSSSPSDLSDARRLRAEGKIEESNAILRRLLGDENWQVRANAISAIREFSERGLLPELHAALKDSAMFVRERATRTLQTVGDATSLPPLRAALASEPDAAVRGNIAEALAKIGGANEIDELAQILQNDQDASVRGRTASALGDIGDARARAALEKSARSDPDAGVRATAAEALKKLK